MQDRVTEEQLRQIYRETIDALYGYASTRALRQRELAEDVYWRMQMRPCTRCGTQRALVVACVVATLATSSLAHAQAGSTPATAVPVTQEPRHHPVYENPLVRVLEVRVPAGDTALWHTHADPHIGVVIESARGWGQPAGGVAADDPRKVGDIIDNARNILPYTHRVGNSDTVAYRYVIGQFLGASGIAAPALSPTGTLRFESENAHARVYRVTLGPGQSTGSHRHAQPGLTIQVTAGALKVDGAPAVAKSPASGAGAWWWRGAGEDHTLRNTGATTIQLVEIDWK